MLTEVSARRGDVERALRALGGRATLGDLVMATARPKAEVEQVITELMAEEEVEVTVSETAVVLYRLAAGLDAVARPREAQGRAVATPTPRRPAWTALHRVRAALTERERTRLFDRKTLQLIRARGGVVSLAELVEHTGLTVPQARREARRLARLFGGEPHPSWDGHVVYAFPDLVESAHGAFHVREPRPAWARAADPMEARNEEGAVRRRLLGLGGAVAAGALAWLATFPPEAAGRVFLLAAVAGASAGAAFVLTGSALGRLARTSWVRLRRAETIRRYALGYVFETALKGKGVVSLDRTVAYLRNRSGGRPIARRVVERALRQLSAEFDAPITELNGDLFFGFRNVKRQFLASHVQRERLRLERKAAGRTVFDSGDEEAAAAERELEEFDLALQGPHFEGETLDPYPREENRMATNKEKLQGLLQQLEQERDELKVKLGLAKLEAREEWQELERKMDGLRGKLKVVGSEAKDASGDVGAAFDVVAEEIKDGFSRLRKLL